MTRLAALLLSASTASAQNVKTAVVPSLPQAQVPLLASPQVATLTAQIADFDAQTPQSDVHSAGIKLEDALTGAHAPTLGPTQPILSAALVYAPVPGKVPMSFTPLRSTPGILPAPAVQTLRARLANVLFQKPIGESIAPHAHDRVPAHIFAPGAGDVVAALAGKADRAAWSDGKAIYFAEPAAGKLLSMLKLPGGGPKQLALSYAGTETLAVLKNRVGAVSVAFIEDSAPVKFLDSAHDVSGIALAPDGLTAAVVDNRGTLRLWRPKESLERVHALKLSVTGQAPLAFAGSGRRLVVGGVGGVYALDLDDQGGRKHFLTIHDRYASMSAVAVSEDGSLISAIDEDGVMHYWDMQRGVEGSFHAAHAGVRALSWAGPRRLVWVDSDGGYHCANLGDDGAVTLLRANGGFFLRDAAMRPDLVLESITAYGASVRIVRPNFPQPAKPEEPQPPAKTPQPAVAAPKPVAPSRAAVIAALRADAAARFAIFPADLLIPRLKSWLKNDSELFRVAARVNLQRLADAGDEEALNALY